MRTNKIPTIEDWKLPNPNHDLSEDLDLLDAYEEFGGKSIEEIASKFILLPSMSRMELFYYMPIVPFQYYIFAVESFFYSEKHGTQYVLDASDSATIFLELVRRKLVSEPEFLMPIIDELMPLIEHVANNQALYDADVKISGSFSAILQDIQTLVDSAPSLKTENNNKSEYQ